MGRFKELITVDAKRTILQEMKKMRNKLDSMGVDISGLSLSYKEPLSKTDEEKEAEEQKELWRDGDEFIKLFTGDLIDIADGLTGPETLIMFAIIPYISYETGMLTVGQTHKRPLRNNDIQAMTKKSDTTITAIMAKLAEKRILSRNDLGRSYQYFANPYIFFKGKFINKTLIAMFRDYAEKRYRK